MNVISEGRFQEELTLPYVEASTRYEGATSGEAVFMLNPPDAQDMADIWLVAQGEEEEGSVDKSLTAVMTGMMESVHKGLSMASGSSFTGTFTNLQVVSEPANSTLFEQVGNAVYVDVSFEISIGSIVQTVVHHILPALLAKQISTLLVSEEELRNAEVQETETQQEEEAPQQSSKQEFDQFDEEKEAPQPFASRVKEPEPKAEVEPNIQNVQFTNFSQPDNPYGEQRNLNMF